MEEQLHQLYPRGRELWVKVIEVQQDGRFKLSAAAVDQFSGKLRSDDASLGGSTYSERRDARMAAAMGETSVASKQVEPTGPVPEMFTIHDAVVSNSTDYCIFCRHACR